LGHPHRAESGCRRASAHRVGRADVHLFASGGIRTGLDIVKCAALGADLVGLASPFLKAAMESAEAVIEEMELLTAEACIAMFCSGARTIDALRRPGVLQKDD
jgi:isopentenyl-diphosphate delta-isomerase